jgi:hypothetical protein
MSHMNLPDVPYAQLQYRNDLLSTEFATDRRARRARKAPRARWVSRTRRSS